jgi:formylmethanofuran dehydrogenase subunit E
MRLRFGTIGVTLLLLPSLLLSSAARAETPEEWIQLGARIHGAFGAFIPVGIRIGLDARQQLGAEPRTLVVTYYSGDKAPCPCIVDGIMLATQASPGQGTLQVAPEKAPPGLLGVAVIRRRDNGKALRYTIADDWLPRILGWNKKFDPAGRYQAAMAAENLFQVAPDDAK